MPIRLTPRSRTIVPAASTKSRPCTRIDNAPEDELELLLLELDDDEELEPPPEEELLLVLDELDVEDELLELDTLLLLDDP